MLVAPETSFARPTPAPRAAAPAPSIYVHPGRFHAAVGAGDFTTVVGSGVVVCVWDPVADVAGMTHFLLPDKGNAPPAPRFGDVALKQLFEDLTRLGAQRHRLRAAVFGGGAPPIAAESGHLGERNVAAAKAFLAANGVAIVQSDVGGGGGRKVTFGGASGRVEILRLNG
ncbi:MAG: chemotaxis protein CheD [Anaeromyxobacteraceae bacterium]